MHIPCLQSSKAAELILMIYKASNLEGRITEISVFAEFNPIETKCPAAGRQTTTEQDVVRKCLALFKQEINCSQ